MNNEKKQFIELSEQALKELNDRIGAQVSSARNVRLFVEGYG